ncbi:MAG: hypothetical protein U1D30_04495 [Planctomycetota bacterium]
MVTRGRATRNAGRQRHRISPRSGVGGSLPLAGKPDESRDTRAWIDMPKRLVRKPFLPRFSAKRSKNAWGTAQDHAVGMPTLRGGAVLLSGKRSADQDPVHPLVFAKCEGIEEVLVDPHQLSEDHTPTSVSFMHGYPRDGRMAAYAVRQGGEDEIAIRFLDVDTRKTDRRRASQGSLFRG